MHAPPGPRAGDTVVAHVHPEALLPPRAIPEVISDWVARGAVTQVGPHTVVGLTSVLLAVWRYRWAYSLIHACLLTELAGTWYKSAGALGNVLGCRPHKIQLWGHTLFLIGNLFSECF